MSAMIEPERFASWSTAYDVARERESPVIAQVGREIGKVSPNGAYEWLRTVTRSGRIESSEGND